MALITGNRMAHFMKQGFSLLGRRQAYLNENRPLIVATSTVLAVCPSRSIGTVNFIHRPTAKFFSKESAIVRLEKFLQIHSVCFPMLRNVYVLLWGTEGAKRAFSVNRT
jgi:hypothetical protein